MDAALYFQTTLLKKIPPFNASYFSSWSRYVPTQITIYFSDLLFSTLLFPAPSPSFPPSSLVPMRTLHVFLLMFLFSLVKYRLKANLTFYMDPSLWIDFLRVMCDDVMFLHLATLCIIYQRCNFCWNISCTKTLLPCYWPCSPADGPVPVDIIMLSLPPCFVDFGGRVPRESHPPSRNNIFYAWLVRASLNRYASKLLQYSYRDYCFLPYDIYVSYPSCVTWMNLYKLHHCNNLWPRTFTVSKYI